MHAAHFLMINTESQPTEYFTQQKAKYNRLLSEIKQKIRTVSIARILVFLITVIGIYFAVANGHKILAILSISGFGLFIYLVRIHIGLEKKKLWNSTLVDINSHELKLLTGNTKEMESGKEFLDSSHPYNSDLDVFGEKSLFQLINRTTTTNGKQELANRLNNIITDINLLKPRQQAISELIGIL